MSPGTVVLGEIRVQQAADLGIVQHHDVVEAARRRGADEAFHGGFCRGARGAVFTSRIPKA